MASLYDLPIGEIKFEHVQAFCANQYPEGQRLDYKRDFSSDPTKQIAKIVCAFANRDGGILVLGVDESDPRSGKPERVPEGVDLGEAPHLRIIDSYNTQITPSVPTVEVSRFLPNPDGSGRGFCIVRVRRSPNLPHQIGNIAYVRDHDRSDPRPATIPEQAALFNTRQSALDLQTNRADAAIERLKRAVESVARHGAARSYVAVVVGPLIADAPVIDIHSDNPGLSMDDVEMPRSPERAADSLYYVESSSGHLIDAFGNSVAVVYLGDLLQENVELVPTCDAWVLNAFHRAGDKAILDKNLFFPFVLAIHRAKAICEKRGVVGTFRIKYQIQGLMNYVLVSDRNAGSYIPLACSRVDTNTNDQVEFDFSKSIDEDWNAMLAAVTRLFFAWGSWRTPQEFAQVLDYAERRALGHCYCEKCNPLGRGPAMRALNRDCCRRCRETRIRAATG